MKITEHALIRLDLILCNHYAHQEVTFMKKFLLPGSYTIHWDRGIQVLDIIPFSERCQHFGLRFLGLEIHFDSPYPLHIYTYEDHGPCYNHFWIAGAIKKLEIDNVTQNIIPTISVPPELINQYLF